MKHGKRVLAALLVLLCMVTLLPPVMALAANRQYTVRFFQGNKGTISGGTVQPVAAGGSATYPEVTPADGYYVKGFVEGGKDPLDGVQTPGGMIYPVMSDLDYVAVYGVLGAEVPYTVQYLLYNTTTKLATDGTFYCDVGDRPVASYIYIEGYEPYLRSTKTITGNPAEDVLVVYYTRIVTPTPPGGGGGGGGGAIVPANPANPANPINPANPANPTEATPVTPQYQQTEDILDLDVPLAEPEIPGGDNTGNGENPTEGQKKLPSWAIALISVAALGLIGLLYWYLLFYLKKKRYSEDEYSDGPSIGSGSNPGGDK